MASEKPFNCKIYVNEDEVYSGDLGEVPAEFREKIIEDLRQWASTLGKRGINELLYSHLVWYEEMEYYCGTCEQQIDEIEEGGGMHCEKCGEEPQRRYIYQRDEKLDKIITCIGLISEIRVLKP